MTERPKILRIDHSNPRVIAARDAEQRLFEHYGFEYSVHAVELAHPPIRIRVLEVGSGPPVVLVPGGSGEAIQYLPLMDCLRDKRFIIPNLPGGGMSDAVDFRKVDFPDLAVRALAAVLDHFELDSAQLAGSSMGGLWTLWLSLARPERVSSLVLFGCPALVLGTKAPLPMRLLSVPLMNRLLFPLARADSPEKVRKMLGMVGCSDEALAAIPEAFVEAMARMFSLPTYRFAWLSLMQTVLRPRGSRAQFQLGSAELSRVQCPTLLIWGDSDSFGGIAVGRECANLIANAKLEVVPAGHVPFLDDPSGCGSLLDRFLQAPVEFADPESQRLQATLC